MMKRLAVMSFSALLTGGGLSAAQDLGYTPAAETVVTPPSEAYGTASLTVFIEGSMNFVGRNSTTTYTTGGGVDRFMTAAGSALQATPRLPNGSQIERIELRACDTSATESVQLVLGHCPTAGMACSLVGQVATGTAATPGCADFAADVTPPFVVNNQTVPLLMSVSPGTSLAASFSSVKLYYRLRVSPAPAVATFPVDVPTTHPFFRFVEAMAASGLTGGCAPGSFCPDSPVTRGQMAVFLANALGLHFPN
jgi:hypothetical protein